MPQCVNNRKWLKQAPQHLLGLFFRTHYPTKDSAESFVSRSDVVSPEAKMFLMSRKVGEWSCGLINGPISYYVNAGPMFDDQISGGRRLGRVKL